MHRYNLMIAQIRSGGFSEMFYSECDRLCWPAKILQLSEPRFSKLNQNKIFRTFFHDTVLRASTERQPSLHPRVFTPTALNWREEKILGLISQYFSHRTHDLPSISIRLLVLPRKCGNVELLSVCHHHDISRRISAERINQKYSGTSSIIQNWNRRLIPRNLLWPRESSWFRRFFTLSMTRVSIEHDQDLHPRFGIEIFDCSYEISWDRTNRPYFDIYSRNLRSQHQSNTLSAFTLDPHSITFHLDHNENFLENWRYRKRIVRVQNYWPLNFTKFTFSLNFFCW